MCFWESCSPNKTIFFWLNSHLNCYINHSSFVIITTLYSEIPQHFADLVTWHSSIYSVKIHLMSTYFLFDTGASQMQACPLGTYSQVRDTCRAVNMKVVEAQCALGAHRRVQYWKEFDLVRAKQDSLIWRERWWKVSRGSTSVPRWERQGNRMCKACRLSDHGAFRKQYNLLWLAGI